ncbi:SCO family protein [Cognatiyoonia sp.]|uniref:SCO family protein n=1 Tax=Cognatiyoonia sp. TaxID=2211652 RepID=UPI003F69CFD9
MDKKIAILSGTALGALILGTAFFVVRGSMVAGACSASVVAGGDIGGPFTLVSGAGETVTEADVIIGPTLLYFGYTFCPDFCPMDVERNAITTDILEENGIDLTPVFVSIDPARDTVEVVEDYTNNFHSKMIGLTGSDEQVKAAADEYRVFYSRADEDPEYYLMNHSVFSYLVTPEDGFIDFFKSDDSPQAVADRIACHVG